MNERTIWVTASSVDLPPLQFIDVSMGKPISELEVGL